MYYRYPWIVILEILWTKSFLQKLGKWRLDPGSNPSKLSLLEQLLVNPKSITSNKRGNTNKKIMIQHKRNHNIYIQWCILFE